MESDDQDLFARRYRAAQAALDAVVAAARGIAVEFALSDLSPRHCRMLATFLSSVGDLSTFFSEDDLAVSARGEDD